MRRIIFSLILVVAMAVISESFASSLKNDCAKLSSCVEAISKLTGIKYLFQEDASIKIDSSSNYELSKENADSIFSEILFISSFARLPQKDGRFVIINARDVRYHTLPEVNASYKNPPTLPDNFDFYQLTYRFENVPAEFGITTEALRYCRPMLSRFGRLTEIGKNQTIIAMDTAKNLAKIYKIFKELDIRPTAAYLKEKEREKAKRDELDKIEAKNCQSFRDELRRMQTGTIEERRPVADPE